ncbi:MAG: FtsX-like permease family protein [Longimicrobiales bacterium]
MHERLPLTGLFGLIGLMLAAIGVYGVLSMHVAQRSREFGIRMALGARRSDVRRLVLVRGAVLAAAGAGIGLLTASGATRVLRSFLFGVSPLDPLTFAAGAGVLIAVALIASYLPARQATQADPLAPLRQE